MRRTLLSLGLLVILLSPLAAQSVKVVSPNGGESWALHSSLPITWTSANAGSVKVDIILRKGGVKVGTIKSQVSLAAGSWPWPDVGKLEDGTVVAAGTDYVVRIRDAANTFGDSSDSAFAIASATGPVVIKAPLQDRVPPSIFQKPRLAVSDIDLTPNVDGFGIIFSYKNVGTGSLPKASQVPVKPNYRVLVDGKETASGSLFIPAFAAPPGWEQQGYFGGWIVLPTTMAAADSNWHIGNMITVHINENKVMGMDSHSLTLNLKTIALKYKYDLVRTGVSLDWNTRELSVSLQLNGNVPPGRELLAWCGRIMGDDDYFMSRQPAHPGYFLVKRKVDFPAHYNQVTLNLVTVVSVPKTNQQVWDMDYRNDQPVVLKFVRPDPNPK